MSAPQSSVSSPGLQKLIAKTEQYESVFQRTYPELYDQIQQFQTPQFSQQQADVRYVEPAPQSLTDTSEQGLASQISQEEYDSVLGRARAVTHLPPGQMDIESALYLEQQLSDMLGFQIATKLQGQQLLHTQGTIRALPHLKRSPTDTAQEHYFAKLPFSNKRGYFGWLHQNPTTRTSPELLEKYYLALPFYLIPEWETQATSLKKWYAFRKVVVVNPHELEAVVCAVGDSFDFGYAKYQFGASPEVIMEGKCWSPKTLGKVLLFFVLDEDDSIPLGPVSMSQFKGYNG